MANRKLYLEDIPLAEAMNRLRRALEEVGKWAPLEPEEVPLDRALGSTTAGPIWAGRSSPHYHAAAMDGYALRSADVQGATDRNPADLLIGSDAQWVDTGDPMPAWADAVVPVELVEAVGPSDHVGRALQKIRLRQGLTPWQHVRSIGEDFVETELLLPGGSDLRPVDIGAIAAAGQERVRVVRQPRVAILPTGDELVPPGSIPRAGQIIETNSWVLASQVEVWGGKATRLEPVPDDLEAIRESVCRAQPDHDLILILSGSSAGADDLTAEAVESLGELLAHGVAVRPGHPVVLGLLAPPAGGGPVPAIGVPGYPVSAALTGEIFIRPLLDRWLGRPPFVPEVIEGELAQKVRSSAGDDEYLRVSIGEVGGRWMIQPLARGAGISSSLVEADGILVIPAGIQGYKAGDRVRAQLRRPRNELERAIIVQGSHDLTLDLMKQELWQEGVRLSSGNVGSLGGLLALSRGAAHLAGSHLLDPETGGYNLSYIDRYLPGIPVVVITLARRQQGLMVASGNPLDLTGLADLPRSDVRFVNRQRGSGTRLLLDFHLGQSGIEPESIGGYSREEYTHLALAADIASGSADCGLGLRAAADALNLDFLPLYEERYDLIIRQDHFESDKLAPLLSLLRDSTFQRKVESLPGYDASELGQIVAELNTE
ncbi:MAG: molybdopterin biosynthesis protein [Anaerolineales bacterium]